MIRTMFFTLAAVVVIVVAYLHFNDPQSHRCNSPCTVVFPAGMEEDEFHIDYTAGTLLVVRVEP